MSQSLVYVVTEGQHDYAVIGAFASRERAESFIEAYMTTDHGSTNREDYDIWDFDANQEIVVRRVYQADRTFMVDGASKINTSGNEGGDTQIVPADFEWFRVACADYPIEKGGGPWCRSQALTPERAIELSDQAYQQWIKDGRPLRDYERSYHEQRR